MNTKPNQDILGTSPFHTSLTRGCCPPPLQVLLFSRSKFRLERQTSDRTGERERGAVVMAERPLSPAGHRLGLRSDRLCVVVVWTRETMVEGGGGRGLSMIV
ncbi:hypothetical protein Hdeb2414_s0865g00955481 [Helianthus debilis subsp. tardiflorus]